MNELASLKRIEIADGSLKVVANVFDGDAKVYRSEVDILDNEDEVVDEILETIVPESLQDADKIVLTAWKNGEEVAKASTEEVRKRRTRYSSVLSDFKEQLS